MYFQTALCYGLHPLEQPITLDHPLRPEDSSYAISKTAGEYYVRLSGLDWVSLRLANAYGPRNVSGPLPTFFSRLTNDQSVFVMDTRRDFIYVQDLIDLVVAALDAGGKGGAYHASSGSDYSIKELLDATVSALGLDPAPEVDVRDRNPDDAFTILLDPSRSRARIQLDALDAARPRRRGRDRLLPRLRHRGDLHAPEARVGEAAGSVSELRGATALVVGGAGFVGGNLTGASSSAAPSACSWWTTSCPPSV